ncbi:efflux RND transporter periplasmic adaptor subunit [Pelagibacterium halotolerans]|uniref:Membrane fusion protein of RND family multidrug efflux pump n=1 Tax=Pelagibacterium halotolerans (strain DSM 22347 / JCM 15775 / CGMCC 1.7692 / B2) TaxID=1082931 RepID=G4R8T2_PELHB|nr:efflux RND transporter periplasmic adaptor subunit [Pelagibacterium halotolerans]AEQ50368.1 membrane fusion protein of RND family multidrug efflux pump [Pelagibacterium halotolerans B2]QJR19654.1 efflux RND transporter periplasmic adaptor subunit [Pelagibacterium halotolerans]SDZ85570.1 RND family efflux transporter, MFP subunit [Pelagibacterium halotolerans]
MENLPGSGYVASTEKSEDQPKTEKPRARFGLISALVRLGLAVLILVLAVYWAFSWVAQRPDAPQRMNRERTFTVEVIDPVYASHSSSITAYGQVASARTIELRSLVAGRVLEISPDFAVGSQVEEGDVLVRVDPFTYTGAVVEARAAVADAELSLAEAEEAYALEQSAITAAQEALTSAQTDLERARSLLSSGAATQQTVDTRALTVSERQQALDQRQSNLVTLNAQILRQQAAIAQAGYALESAERDLANTEITAPFTGIVTARNVTASAYVGANEAVASIYESDALEVSFMVSDATYATLRRDGLFDRSVEVSRTTGTDAERISGRIARVAPEIDSATGGVTLYAELDSEGAELLRPGTFVSVEVEGVTHENTLLVPETALYDDNHLYVIRDGRMAAVDVDIRDRDGAQIIISADIAEGERIITTRLSQAGEGVAVQVEGEEQATGPQGGDGPGGPGGGPVVIGRGPGG